MSEIAVSKKTSDVAGKEPVESSWPILPLSRFWGFSPFSILRELTNEMDRMIRGGSLGTEIQTWSPAVDVRRCNGDLVVSAELPGLKKEDIKVEVTEEALVIEGERKREHKEDHEGYHRWERNYGRFYRVLPLPEGAKTEQVKAELKDGVLRISVPVPELAKSSRQIPVTG
jgi:HSP20 family protein